MADLSSSPIPLSSSPRIDRYTELIRPNFELLRRLDEQEETIAHLSASLKASHDREQQLKSVADGLQQLLSAKCAALETSEAEREAAQSTAAQQHARLASLSATAGTLRAELDRVYAVAGWSSKR